MANKLIETSSWKHQHQQASPDRHQEWPVTSHKPRNIFHDENYAQPDGGYTLIFTKLTELACKAFFVYILNKLFIKHIVKRKSLVFEDHRKCSSGFTWHLPLRKRSTYFVTRIANLVLLYGLRDFWSGITGIKVHHDSQWNWASRNLWQTSLQFFLIGWWKRTSVWKEYENEINRHSILWLWVKWIE